jgi:hypothetical protein
MAPSRLTLRWESSTSDLVGDEHVYMQVREHLADEESYLKGVNATGVCDENLGGVVNEQSAIHDADN